MVGTGQTVSGRMARKAFFGDLHAASAVLLYCTVNRFLSYKKMTVVYGKGRKNC